MTIRKQKIIDKENQKMLSKSFLTLLYKEKIFRYNKPITQVSVKKYNSQYRFNLFYDDHNDWIHGTSYRVTIFFKASKEIEVRVRCLRMGVIYQNKISYPKNTLERAEAEDISRGVIKECEQTFSKRLPWQNQRFTGLKISDDDVAFYKSYLRELTNWFFVEKSLIREIEYINRDKDRKLAKVKFKTDEGVTVVAETPIPDKVCFYLTISRVNKRYLELFQKLKEKHNKLPKKVNALNKYKYKRMSKEISDVYENLLNTKPYAYENFKLSEIDMVKNNNGKAIKENYKLFKNNNMYGMLKELLSD